MFEVAMRYIGRVIALNGSQVRQRVMSRYPAQQPASVVDAAVSAVLVQSTG